MGATTAMAAWERATWPAPHLREGLEGAALGDEDEIPPLAVHGGGGSPCRFENPIDVGSSKRLGAEAANVATRGDRRAGVHRVSVGGEPTVG